MSCRFKQYSIVFSLFALFTVLFFFTPEGIALTVDLGKEWNGPYVDKITYNVIPSADDQVLALQNNEVDVIGDMIDPAFLPTLESADDIELANVLRNGYGYVSINTQKYPFNFTAFRRALAFALDKQAISDDVWDGLSMPLDSCIPAINPFSCEGLLPYTYYDTNVVLGNQMLDDAGFFIDSITGFRLAPNGDPFDVIVEVSQSSGVAIEVGQKVADALTALHVDAAAVPTDFYEYLNRLYFHGDYDILFLTTSFNNFDVDWLAYEFWSEFAVEPYYNFPNWQNTTYDSWRDQLLHATAYEDVYEAAFNMQEIWVYECPEIVCYENILLSAFRTDRFEGHVNDVSEGVPGWWTNYKVHLKSGQAGAPWGSTFRWSTPLDLDTFNFMMSESSFTSNVVQMLYEPLIRIDGAGNDILWIAEDYTVETHADNPAVPDGYTRFWFDILQNATWSDGTPFTAEDVAYSFNYYRDSPGNPYGPDLYEMTAAYAPTTYRLIVEFSSESYWHLHSLGYKPIIPKHFFLTLGLDGWNTWNPNPPVDEMITSGPFNISDYVAGEFCELTYNPDYFYSLSRDDVYTTSSTTETWTTTSTWTTTPWGWPTPTSTDETTTSPSTSNPTQTPTNPTTTGEAWFGSTFSTISMVITIGSLAVIVVFGVLIIRAKVYR